MRIISLRHGSKKVSNCIYAEKGITKVLYIDGSVVLNAAYSEIIVHWL